MAAEILPLDVLMRAALRVTQLVEQLVEVPTIVSYSSLQRTMEQHVDIPVPPGRGGRNAGLQGSLPGQSATADRCQSRFPKIKKVRSWVRTRVRGCPPVSAHAPLPDSNEWTQFSKGGKPNYWNRRSNATAWKPPPGVKVVWVGSRDEDGSSTAGTRLLVSVGVTFLLCLLSDGRRGQWLGIPSPHPGCHHVPVTMQPKFQQSFLFMFWRCPRFSPRSECPTFQLYAELATWWCKLSRKPSGFRQRSSWCSFRAMLGSTVDTCSASAPGCFWTFFLRVGGTRLLKSILSCSPLWPRSSSTTAVVCGSGFLVTVHLALCSLRLLQAWEWRSRTDDASVATSACS